VSMLSMPAFTAPGITAFSRCISVGPVISVTAPISAHALVAGSNSDVVVRTSAMYADVAVDRATLRDSYVVAAACNLHICCISVGSCRAALADRDSVSATSGTDAGSRTHHVGRGALYAEIVVITVGYDAAGALGAHAKIESVAIACGIGCEIAVGAGRGTTGTAVDGHCIVVTRYSTVDSAVDAFYIYHVSVLATNLRYGDALPVTAQCGCSVCIANFVAKTLLRDSDGATTTNLFYVNIVGSASCHGWRSQWRSQPY